MQTEGTAGESALEMRSRLACVCIASSRVGATTRTEMGAFLAFLGVMERMCSMAGTPKATVLPELEEENVQKGALLSLEKRKGRRTQSQRHR